MLDDIFDQGEIKEIVLKRMRTADIADKRKMFQLFAHLHTRAGKGRDSEAEKYITEASELWTGMMLEEIQHDSLWSENVLTVQKQCTLWLHECYLSLIKVETGQMRNSLQQSIMPTVSMKLTLALDFLETGSEGSSQRKSFELDLVADLRNASIYREISPSNFCFVKLPLGNVMIDMRILPDNPLDDFTLFSVALDFEEQVLDPHSKLRCGMLTKYIQDIVMVHPEEIIEDNSMQECGALSDSSLEDEEDTKGGHAIMFSRRSELPSSQPSSPLDSRVQNNSCVVKYGVFEGVNEEGSVPISGTILNAALLSPPPSSTTNRDSIEMRLMMCVTEPHVQIPALSLEENQKIESTQLLDPGLGGFEKKADQKQQVEDQFPAAGLVQMLTGFFGTPATRKAPASNGRSLQRFEAGTSAQRSSGRMSDDYFLNLVAGDEDNKAAATSKL